jgi:phosphoglycerate dehydrogenase-like enzyme
MSRPRAVRVVSAAGLTAAQAQRVRAVSERIELVETGTAPEELWRRLEDAEVLLGHFRETGFDPGLAPRLRWIHLTSASVERIFDQPLIRTDVTFTNSSGIHAAPIAEYVLGTMLALARHFPALFARAQRRHWSTAAEVYESFVGRELRGATLGIVGYGSIGREVGRLGSGFGMRVLALKRDPSTRADPGWAMPGVGDPEGAVPARFFAPEELRELLAASDYVVLACPLTAATAGMIDAAALGSMRPHAFVVNVSRGALVDEPALVRALRDGRIAGAALDVASIEPLPPESELFDLPNVILTPHCSGTTPSYVDRAVDCFCDNLGRYLEGRPLWNVIDRARRY